MSSAQTTKVVLAEGKCMASAYCQAWSHVDDGERRQVPVHVKYLLLVQWRDANSSTDRIARLCFIREEEENAESRLDDVCFCSHVYRFDAATGMGAEREREVDPCYRYSLPVDTDWQQARVAHFQTGPIQGQILW